MITEESFVDFKCPYCGEPVSFPRENAGFVQECPSCFQSLIVPKDGSDTGFKIPVPILTPRLILRRFEPGDWKDLLEFMGDEEIFQYLEGHPLDEDAILRWLESDSHVRLTTLDHMYCLGIQSKDAGKLIGYVGLQSTDPQRLQATFHVVLNRSFQHQGFAVEAVEALLGFCFEGISMHRIAASCDSRNAAAIRLLENLGLRKEGEFLKDRFIKGEWVSTVWYAALKEEYKQAAAS